MKKFLCEWICIQIIFVIVFLGVKIFINKQNNKYSNYEEIYATVDDIWYENDEDTYYGTANYEFDSSSYSINVELDSIEETTMLLYVNPDIPTSVITKYEMDNYIEKNESILNNKFFIVLLAPILIAGLDSYCRYRKYN